jgi:uncharacterized protein YdeI (YjbR/CyaY-like superfamily)
VEAPNKKEIRAFKTLDAWEAFLAKPGALAGGVWLRLYKKDSGIASITYAEAVEGALCHGWIDSQKNSLDAVSWVQRFSPRKPKGLWSKANTDHVERLTKAGRMKPAGLREVQAAKADGRWESAYAGSKTMEVPKDFLEALARHKAAKAFFATLNRANLYAIAWRLQTAKKPETRQKRFDALLQMLEDGRKIH